MYELLEVHSDCFSKGFQSKVALFKPADLFVKPEKRSGEKTDAPTLKKKKIQNRQVVK